MKKVFAVMFGFGSIFSLFFVVASIVDLVGGDKDTGAGVLAGLLVFFGCISAGSAFLARTLWRKDALNPVAMEPKMLALAKDHGGRLTVAEVSIAHSLSLKDAKICLDHLVTSSAAELLVSDSGAMVYEVALIKRLEKSTAENVLAP